MRPLLCRKNWPPLYHVSERPDDVRWDGMENGDPVRKNGVILAFRGSIENQPEHRFVLAGLNAGKRYRLPTGCPHLTWFWLVNVDKSGQAIF
jgi:hypothetical protein